MEEKNVQQTWAIAMANWSKTKQIVLLFLFTNMTCFV
jgi:hypothetical protein